MQGQPGDWSIHNTTMQYMPGPVGWYAPENSLVRRYSSGRPGGATSASRKLWRHALHVKETHLPVSCDRSCTKLRSTGLCCLYWNDHPCPFDGCRGKDLSRTDPTLCNWLPPCSSAMGGSSAEGLCNQKTGNPEHLSALIISFTFSSCSLHSTAVVIRNQ